MSGFPLYVIAMLCVYVMSLSYSTLKVSELDCSRFCFACNVSVAVEMAAESLESSLTKLLVTHAQVARDGACMFSQNTLTDLVWSLLQTRGRVPRNFRETVREFFESFAELAPLPSEPVYTMNHLKLLCTTMLGDSFEIDNAAWEYMAQRVANFILQRQGRAMPPSGATAPPRPRSRAHHLGGLQAAPHVAPPVAAAAPAPVHEEQPDQQHREPIIHGHY